MTLDPPRPPPAALIFDLDGTLIDSRRDIVEACNEARVTHGLPPLPFETIIPMVGDGARALVVRAFGVGDRDPMVEGALATYNAKYLARPCVHTVLLPGAQAILEDAAAMEIPCGVVTNKPRELTVAVMAAIGIAPFFRAIWGGGDGPLKPAPDGVLAVMARLGGTAQTTWMIGDGPQDIGAGKAAKCFTVGVPGIAPRAVLVASAPDLLIDTLLDLRALLLTAGRA